MEKKLMKIRKMIDGMIDDQKDGKIKLSRNIGRIFNVINEMLLLKAMIFYSEKDKKEYLTSMKRIDADLKKDKELSKKELKRYVREVNSMSCSISNRQA